MHRTRGRRQTQVAGLTWRLRRRMIKAAEGGLIDARNRALLAVAYDTLLRRSELVSLEVSDLAEEADGSATLLVRTSKTDPEGTGATVFLARDTVGLVKAWLDRSGVTKGRLFPFGAEGRHGGVEARPPARCRASTRRWPCTPGFLPTPWPPWPGTARAWDRFRT